MSVRNIDKGYIGSAKQEIDTSNIFTTKIQFSGPFSIYVAATFQRFGDMVSLTLDPIVGTVTTAGTLTGSIPSGWFPTDAQGFINYMHVLNSTRLGVGDYAGYIFYKAATYQLHHIMAVS